MPMVTQLGGAHSTRPDSNTPSSDPRGSPPSSPPTSPLISSLIRATPGPSLNSHTAFLRGKQQADRK